MLLSTALSARTTNDLHKRSERGQRQAPGGRRSARPRLEMLENRTLLSVDVVTNTNGSGPGSLVSTISSASPGDTITFASNVTGTITLTNLRDQVLITENLDIEGPGADRLTISGNGEFGVFDVGAGVTATVAGLTLANANNTIGGAINNAGTLTINNCTFSDNFGSGGGAIYNAGGYSTGGTLTINNSTFSDNTGANGGAIENDGGTVTINNSTFAGNLAEVLGEVLPGSAGGAIINVGGTLTVTDSTLSGNSAAAEGGGIDNTSGFDNSPGTLILANTIIAGNTAPAGPDVSGAVTSLGYNLIGNSSGASGFVATDLQSVNPLLGPLQNNGGPTETMALLPGSPAIDAGNVALALDANGNPLTTDQRGAPRNVFGGVDIGAFEGQVYQVSFTTDSGGGSLRSAMIQANQYGGSIIAFSTSGVITLASPLPAISDDVQILGPGANNLTISGNDAVQVFQVDGDATATIAGLTIASGVAASGGAIFSAGTLTVSDCAFAGNSAQMGGGGIDNVGALTVTNSTFEDNRAESGGGIRSGSLVGSSLNVTNATFSGNSAQIGGGIACVGLSAISDSTLSDNSASTSGGGLAMPGGTLILANTIIAGNTAPTGPDVDGVATSLGYNLIGDPSGASGFVTSDLLNVNAVLGPLQNNGGPTETMAVLPGSPAIGAGSVGLIPAGITTDQRRLARIVNGAVDIGAFESRGFTITVTSGNEQVTLVNTPFPAPLVVTVSSPSGDPVAGGIVTFAAPLNLESCTFPGGSNTATATINASGQASIAATANGIAGPYGLSASALGVGLTGFVLTNSSGPPTRLVIDTQPSATTAAGQILATQPVVYEEDAAGNLDKGDNTTQVTVSLAGGGGTLHGTLTVTVSGGIATFTNLADNTAGTIQLLFTSTSALASATSSNIVISPAQPSQLVIHTQPSPTATTGQPFPTQPVVYEEDQYGNLEAGDNSTKVTASLRVGTGPLLGTTTVTVAGGIATFTNLADDTAETILLVFTSPGLNKATSSSIVVSSGGNHGSIGGGVAKVKLKHMAGDAHQRLIRDASHPGKSKPRAEISLGVQRPRYSKSSLTV